MKTTDAYMTFLIFQGNLYFKGRVFLFSLLVFILEVEKYQWSLIAPSNMNNRLVKDIQILDFILYIMVDNYINKLHNFKIVLFDFKAFFPLFCSTLDSQRKM